jgi:hypothetical protein
MLRCRGAKDGDAAGETEGTQYLRPKHAVAIFELGAQNSMRVERLQVLALLASG